MLTSESGGGGDPPPVRLLCTHNHCFDGHAAAVLLELCCRKKGWEYALCPHSHYRSFREELRDALTRFAGREVHFLLFDVAPDAALVGLVRETPQFSLTCGDHHETNRELLVALAAEAHPRMEVMFSTKLAGVELAWNWVFAQFGGKSISSMTSLGYLVDTMAGMGSRILNVIACADLHKHKGDPEAEAVDAAMRMRESPVYSRVKDMVLTPGWYASLLADGPLCCRIRDQQVAALLQRGGVFCLSPPVCEALTRLQGGEEGPPAAAYTVFYLQGAPFLTTELSCAVPVDTDMVWVWSKNEAADPDKKYAVAIRRGRRGYASAAAVRCDQVARALAENGGGHAAAAGVGLPVEPIAFLTKAGLIGQ